MSINKAAEMGGYIDSKEMNEPKVGVVLRLFLLRCGFDMTVDPISDFFHSRISDMM